MKTILILNILGICAATSAVTDIPPLLRQDARFAQTILASKHDSIALWPEQLPLGSTLRTPKPINSKEELKAVLSAAPDSFNSGFRFTDIVEFDGWFAASLDERSVKHALWILGVIVKKGSNELYCFSHW